MSALGQVRSFSCAQIMIFAQSFRPKHISHLRCAYYMCEIGADPMALMAYARVSTEGQWCHKRDEAVHRAKGPEDECWPNCFALD